MVRYDELPPKKRYGNAPLPQAADAGEEQPPPLAVGEEQPPPPVAGEQAPPPVSGEAEFKTPAQSTRTAHRASSSVERDNAQEKAAAVARKRASAKEKNRSDAAGGQPSASVSVEAAATSVASASSTGSRFARRASSSGALKKTNHSDAAKLPNHFGRRSSGDERNRSDEKAAVGKKRGHSVGAKTTPQASGGGKYRDNIRYNGFNSGRGNNRSGATTGELPPPLVSVGASSMPLAQSIRPRRTGSALASSSEAEATGNALDDFPDFRKKKTPGNERNRHAAMSREPPPKRNRSDAAMPVQAAAPQAAGSGISGDGRNRSAGASKSAPAGERNRHAAMSREPPPKRNRSDAAMPAHAAALQAAGSGISGAKKKSFGDEFSRSSGGGASKPKAPASSSRGSTQGKPPSPADSDEDNKKQREKKSAPAFNGDKKKSSGDEFGHRSGGGGYSKSKAPATSSRGSTQGKPTSPADSDEDDKKQEKKKSAPAFKGDKKKSSGDEFGHRSGGGSALFR